MAYTRKGIMPNLYIGIDPGVNGGIVCIGDVVHFQPLSQLSRIGIFHHLEWLKTRGICIIALEKISGYIANSAIVAARSFTLGETYGALLMALDVLQLSYKNPTPQVWQRLINIPVRRKLGKKFVETSDQYKKRLKEVAQIAYPEYTNEITLQTCDALLLALYAKGETV